MITALDLKMTLVEWTVPSHFQSVTGALSILSCEVHKHIHLLKLQKLID